MGTTEFWLFSCLAFAPDAGNGVTTGTATFDQNNRQQAWIRLGASPVAVRAGLLDWTELDCDSYVDQVPSGMTTVGPEFPNGDQTGGLALSLDRWNKIDPTMRPTLPPPGFEQLAYDYEFKAIQHWTDATKMPPIGRYRGFYAKNDGKNVLVWQSGTGKDTSPSAPPPVQTPLAAFQWSSCDPTANGYSKLDGQSPPGTAGALYIDPVYAYGTLGLRTGPKLPIGYGTINARLEQHELPAAAYAQALTEIVWKSVPGFEFSLAQLEQLARFTAENDTHRGGLGYSLDVIGHSAGDDQLLQVRDQLFDAGYVQRLAPTLQSPVFRASGIHRIRLLGCNTARTAAGRAAIIALARTAGVPVFGTRSRITHEDFDAYGFRGARSHLLVDNRELEAMGPPIYQMPSSPRRAPATATIAGLSDDWFAPYVDRHTETRAGSLLAKPDALTRRPDGTKQSAIYASEALVQTFPTAARPLAYTVTDLDGLRDFIAAHALPATKGN